MPVGWTWLGIGFGRRPPPLQSPLNRAGAASHSEGCPSERSEEGEPEETRWRGTTPLVITGAYRLGSSLRSERRRCALGETPLAPGLPVSRHLHQHPSDHRERRALPHG